MDDRDEEDTNGVAAVFVPRSLATPLTTSSISMIPPFLSLLCRHTSTTCTANAYVHSPTPKKSHIPFLPPLPSGSTPSWLHMSAKCVRKTGSERILARCLLAKERSAVWKVVIWDCRVVSCCAERVEESEEYEASVADCEEREEMPALRRIVRANAVELLYR